MLDVRLVKRIVRIVRIVCVGGVAQGGIKGFLGFAPTGKAPPYHGARQNQKLRGDLESGLLTVLSTHRGSPRDRLAETS
jgi:hypothetical protein